ncbi:MAG: hypothetical protein ACRDJY_01480 [Thermoleophilaceae bacterium]
MARCSKATHNGRTRRLGTSLLLIACAAGLAAPAAGAHGAGIGIHQIGTIACRDGGRLEIDPPRQMLSWYSTNFRNAEFVQWSPDIYRWNARRERWRRFYSSPWYWATSSSYGYFQAPYENSPWHHPTTNANIIYVLHTIYRRGYYRIKNYLYWASAGYTHAQWSGWCRFS